MAIWIDAFKVGELVSHPVYGDKRYTEEQLTESVANFRKLRSQGYTTTILREHGREDSYVYGEIHDVRLHGGWFQVYGDFHRTEERQAYNDGILREFSPGFAPTWLDPHTGEELNNVLIEISFTSRAYQRNLRAPQDINPGVTLSDLGALHAAYSGHLLTPQGGSMAEEEKPVEAPDAEEAEAVETTEEEETEAEFNMREEFGELKSAFYALRDALMPAEKEEEPEEVSMSDEETKIADLEAELADLKAEKLRMELSAKGIPADRVGDLVQMSAKLDAEEFAKVVEYSRPTATVQAEIGATGAVEAGVADTTANELVQLAAKHGVSYGNGLTAWAHENHPDRINEILEAARH